MTGTNAKIFFDLKLLLYLPANINDKIATCQIEILKCK